MSILGRGTSPGVTADFLIGIGIVAVLLTGFVLGWRLTATRPRLGIAVMLAAAVLVFVVGFIASARH